MKRKNFTIGLIIIFSFLMCFPITALTQGGRVRLSLNASVTQRLGTDTDITINYCRPGVKGRKIWGGLVPYGLAPGNEYSKGKPFPWRTGANDNTTIEFNKDIMMVTIIL